MTINVTNISPVPGSRLATGATLAFDVTFSPPASALEHVIQIAFGNSSYELAWDGEGHPTPYVASSRQPISGGYRYTIRRTGSWPGVPTVSVRGLSESIGSAEFTSHITVDRTKVMTASSYLGKVFMGPAEDGHTVGAVVVVNIEEDEVDDQEDLVLAPDWDPTGDVVAAFDPTKFQSVVATCVESTGRGRFLVSLKEAPLNDDAPTIVSLVVNGANADRISATFSTRMLLPDIDDVTLDFDAGTPVALDSVSASNADGTAWTIDLAGEIGEDAEFSVVLGAEHTWRALNGPYVAPGSYPVTVEGFVYDYDSAPNLTAHLDPSQGHAAADGGLVASWASTVGSITLTASGSERPTYRADKGGIPAMETDGTNTIMVTTATVGDFFNATTGYMAVLLWVDAITTANFATVYQNVGVVCDITGYWGVFIKDNPEIRGYIYDGSIESGNANAAIVTGEWMLVTMRWEGGNMYIGVNGVESSAEGLDAGIDVTGLGTAVRFFRGPGGGGLRFDGWMGRGLFFDAVPDGSTRTAIQDSMMAEAGIS